MPEADDLISVDEAVRLYKRSRFTIFAWLRAGKLTRYESAGDRRTLVSRREIEELIRPRPRDQSPGAELGS